MSLVTPTTPTIVSAPVPAVVLATATVGTRSTLDLRTAWGAWVFVRIGRRVVTALTVAARVVIRPTINGDTIIHPGQSMDRVSSTAAAGAKTTLSGATSIGAQSIPLTSATGFAAGDIICLHSDDTSAARVEFARVSSVSGSNLIPDSPLKLAHSSADACSNGADVFARMFIPGGSTYEIFAENGASGQSLVFEVQAQTYPSDSIV